MRSLDPLVRVALAEARQVGQRLVAAPRAMSARVTTMAVAMPPGYHTAQSSRRSGEAIMREASTSSTVIGPLLRIAACG